MVKKLVDRIGLAALQMDAKLMKLIQDVPTCEITDLYEGGCTKNTIVMADNLNLNTIYSLTRMYDMRLLIQTSHDNFNYNLIMSALLSKYPDAIVKNPLPTIMRSKNSGDGDAVTFKFDSSQVKRELMQEIKKFLQSSVAQNVLLLSDACFGGSILRDVKDYSKKSRKISSKKSRIAMTSGSMESVPDHSVGSVKLDVSEVAELRLSVESFICIGI